MTLFLSRLHVSKPNFQISFLILLHSWVSFKIVGYFISWLLKAQIVLCSFVLYLLLHFSPSFGFSTLSYFTKLRKLRTPFSIKKKFFLTFTLFLKDYVFTQDFNYYLCAYDSQLCKLSLTSPQNSSLHVDRHHKPYWSTAQFLSHSS